MLGDRNHEKTTLVIATAAIMAAMFLSAGCSRELWKASSGDRPEVTIKEGWTEVGRDIFVFTSDFYLANSVVIVSGDGAVLVDTGENRDDRKKIESFLAERKLKLKNIIITHMHSDHSANLEAFKTEDMNVITPLTSKDGQTYTLGDVTLKIMDTEGHYMPGGHISVEVVEKNILIAGDVICNNIIPPIAAGGDLKELLATLERLKAAEYSLIIPGHGEIADNKLIFERQSEYLENAMEQVEKVIAARGGISELKDIRLEDCVKDTSYLFKERLDYWHRATLEVIFQQLEKK